MNLFELFKALMNYRECEKQEIQYIFNSFPFLQEIFKFIQKILKVYGHEILTEIKKPIYKIKEKNIESNNKQHYNGMVLSFLRKFNPDENNDYDELLYQEINDSSFFQLKKLYDFFLESNLNLEQIFWNIFNEFILNSNLFKIIELMDSNMLFNQKLV